MTPNPNPSPELREAVARVERIETVPLLHPFDDTETPPIWRVMVGQQCADFDYETAARNFADAVNAALSPQTLPAPGEEWTRTQAFGEAAVECLRAAEESKFADTVSEDERKGYRTACTLMSMSFRVMASRAAPDWPLEAGRNAGALLDDRVSDEFLKGVPEEVRLKIERLREDTRTIQRNTATYRQEARAEADAAIERAAEANKRADNMAEANRRLLAMFEADPTSLATSRSQHEGAGR